MSAADPPAWSTEGTTWRISSARRAPIFRAQHGHAHGEPHDCKPANPAVRAPASPDTRRVGPPTGFRATRPHARTLDNVEISHSRRRSAQAWLRLRETLSAVFTKSGSL